MLLVLAFLCISLIDELLVCDHRRRCAGSFLLIFNNKACTDMHNAHVINTFTDLKVRVGFEHLMCCLPEVF